jgi:hypothetical protein
MWFFIGRFILFWTLWVIFADRKRWREIFPVSIFAGLVGSTTDNITQFYGFWEYYGQQGLKSWVIKVMDDWGIYIVIVYLFIQWLPKQRAFGRMFGYWFIWTSLAISIEWIHVITNHMEHNNGWGFWHSYVSDWFLFWLFYQYHKVFKLERLIDLELEK